VDYQEYPPHPALRPFIRTYWSLCGCARDALPQPVLPDGNTELVVHRERPFLRCTAAGSAERQASTLFVGPMRSPVVLVADSSAEVAAVRFRPNGAFALLGVPQHLLQDAITDVATLEIPWLRRTMRESQDAPSVRAAIARLEAGLLERVERSGARTDARVDAVIAAIDGASGSCRIDAVAGVADSGRRHLERLFREQVGLTPKAYARDVRFTAAAARVMENPSSRLADVSSDAGYFDQSHMIRDFLSFAGRTPEEFRTLLGELTRVMLAGDEPRQAHRRATV
jgi:AraC-like DNA-binding protein